MTRLKAVHSALFALVLALLVQALPNTANAAPPIPDGDLFALFQAIAEANSSSGGTIKLAKNGTYELTDGSLAITTEITIEGRGATIDGAGQSRVIDVNGGNLTLIDLTVTGGSNTNYGGGIYVRNGGTVNLNSSTVSGNSSAEYGGGIYNDLGSTVNLNDSTVSENIVTFPEYGDGGGIYNNGGTVNLNDSTVSENSITAGIGSGGGIYNNGGTVNLNDSTVSKNSINALAVGLGGGIYIEFGTVNLNGTSKVNKNMGANDGGGIYIYGGTVNLNDSCNVNWNIASESGGGIWSKGTLNENGGSVLHNEPDDIFEN